MEGIQGLAILATGSRLDLAKVLLGRFDFVIRVSPPRKRRRRVP
jgi:hypothetical protein